MSMEYDSKSLRKNISKNRLFARQKPKMGTHISARANGDKKNRLATLQGSSRGWSEDKLLGRLVDRPFLSSKNLPMTVLSLHEQKCNSRESL
jgi:hypothetical protein